MDFFQVMAFISHLANRVPNQRFLKNHPITESTGIAPRHQLPLPQGITCHCSKAPLAASAATVPMHYMILPPGITCHCTNVSHVVPRHHMSLRHQMQFPQARHQVPSPQEVHIIASRYYMSLPPSQAITCHCPVASAAIRSGDFA